MRRTVFALAIGVSGALTPACSRIFDLPTPEADPVDGGSGEGGPFIRQDVDVAPAFCATLDAGALYCQDFDGNETPTLPDLGTVKQREGAIAIATTIALSPPRALAATVSGTLAAASLVRSLEAAPNGATLSTDILVSKWGGAGAQLLQLELADGQVVCTVRLLAGAQTWSALQICTRDGVETERKETASTEPVVLQRWQRVALTVGFQPRASISAAIDGRQILREPGLVDLHAANTSISYGIDGAEAGSAAVFVDNVLVTSP